MQEVILVIHLILAITIIGLVLLQRSSGGGLGTSAGGLGDFATARGAASALSRTTMICAFLFFGTSLTLAIIAKGDHGGGLLSNIPASAEAPVMPTAPDGTQSPVETLADPAAAPNVPVTPEPPVSTE